MKKVILLSLLLIFTIFSSVQALNWVYTFVVWDGNVYEVSEEIVPISEIGKNIGKVKTKSNDMTGEYYGDASNFYPKGTKYYEISGTSTESAIAVEVHENQYVKAFYKHEADFHWMNLVIKGLPYFFILIAISSSVIFVLKKKNRQY